MNKAEEMTKSIMDKTIRESINYHVERSKSFEFVGLRREFHRRAAKALEALTQNKQRS